MSIISASYCLALSEKVKVIKNASVSYAYGNGLTNVTLAGFRHKLVDALVALDCLMWPNFSFSFLTSLSLRSGARSALNFRFRDMCQVCQ